MANKRKIINDPVFGFITVPGDLVFDVLQHPYLQRLNRIRQLGLSFFVYPGAQHSRFLHSLGAMHLMQEAIAVLRQKGIDISHQEGVAAAAAILMHDIGHGPFSHVLEHTLVEGLSHEDLSLLLMKKINEQMGDRLDMAISIFKDDYPRHFLHQLISSQLDMDRMDYLCRDSFFTGVTEGSVASARILKMLNVVDDRLVVEQKGIYSIEKFLVARRLMYWQVYLHKTSVGAEQLLIKILKRARELAHRGVELWCSPALHFFLYHDVSAQDLFSDERVLERYVLLDDSDILSAVKSWMSAPDVVLATLSSLFTNRQLFKVRMLEEPIREAEREEMRSTYQQRLKVDKQDADYFFDEYSVSKDTYSVQDDSIAIMFSNGEIKDISEASDMLNMQVLTKRVIKHYLFYLRLQ